jgi:starch-binding outer membrane protein, SusD/RagB family
MRKDARLAARPRALAASVGVLGLAALTGCDLGVVNPALIAEDDLQISGAVPAIVNGARHAFGRATTIDGAGGVYSVSAALTDELTHVGSWVPPREISNGVPGNESPENQSHWGRSSVARWQAEDAIEKVSALVTNPQANQWVALATLYAGFANRLLGENFCDAVIDGGPLQPHTVFFERADQHFARAIQIATAAGAANVVSAAYAGRAQVRMSLGRWNDAVADAGRVPTAFVYAQPHSDNSANEANGVYEWAALTSGQYSVWGTPFAQWGRDVSGTAQTEGDPRATFRWRSQMGGGSPARPFWFAEKYTSRNDAIPIAKGTEMRLIEAEAALRNNDLATMLAKVNEVRARHGLQPATAASAAEAWPLLMKERGLELWLEGRRLGDLRRWGAEAAIRPYITSTTLRLGEVQRNVLEATPFCLRISTDEIFSNPNDLSAAK